MWVIPWIASGLFVSAAPLCLASVLRQHNACAVRQVPLLFLQAAYVVYLPMVVIPVSYAVTHDRGPHPLWI